MGTKPRKVSIERLQGMAGRSENIVMLTVYDFPAAQIAEEAGIDIVFVGDSLAMVVLGYPSTVPVTLDEMLPFMKAVSRGAQTPLLLGDMPFGTYLTTDQALYTAGRIVKEGGMDAVKLEGGKDVADIVRCIVSRGIPAMGHIGLTPQTSNPHGGNRVQGKNADAAKALLEDAIALEEAGAFGLVLELVPVEVAQMVSERLTIPTIGIGSGIACDGQVLVWHDLLGMYSAYGKHVKRYVDLRSATLGAVQEYTNDVRQGIFPNDENTWHMREEEVAELVTVG